MDNFLNFQNIVSLLFLIIYGVVFIIQQTQFRKQKNLLEKYERIFDIINIDEIEKYVNLNKKSTELMYSNREMELQNLEDEYKITSDKIGEILNSTESNMSKTDKILKELKSELQKNHLFVEGLMELNKKEFGEIYEAINNKLPKKLERDISRNLIRITKKYDSLKKAELKKL